MNAKEITNCDYALCPHGNRIRIGEEITWNRKVSGTRYHVDCFVAVKGLGAYAPVKRENEGKGITITSFDDFPEVEVVVETPCTELRHFLYPLLAHYVGVRQHVYLWGAPGAGKSFVAKQIAKALGLNFSFVSVNPQSSSSLLLGYMDANGVYRESELFKRWRDGGVFLFDEQDNCSSSLLTILNGMLASDEASFPCGMVPKHSDFIFVGTGNTTGRGNDWQFPERRKIDEASIDRLAFIKWEYDNLLEVSLVADCKHGAVWAGWIQSVRAYCSNKANGIKGGVYASPRAIMAGVKDLALLGRPFFSLGEIADRHVFKGADADIVARVLANCPLPRL